ncbi:MAG: VOC family protein [Candidatus Dadabacteria bacterium]|nr:VOC family protein [Candidatus Dadabacteria bacterium]NIS08789.1 VOC family protein [Candidatus Dadabacteria bacterium]NIV42732.1 VOC family protein [Candidatus Dadabacteria bacterium]NIY22133.1 VOC family protein [Candidatus Dadabacteria bacterium]
MPFSDKVLNWFEIPAKDIDRAVKFYNDIFEANFEIIDFQGNKMAFFTDDYTKTGGALVQNEYSVPAQTGTRVYFSGGNDLSGVLSRVTGAGGKVIFDKMKISDEYGYYGVFEDTEGNHVGLHSNS